MNRASIFIVCALTLGASSAVGQIGRGVAATRLNIRACPSAANCPTTRTLPPKTDLEILGQTGDWLNIRTVPEGEVGWVHSKYVVRLGDSGMNPPNPGLAAARKESSVNTLHALVLFPLLGIPLVDIAKKQLELRAGRSPGRGPFSDLVLSPRIVVSWGLLLAGIIFGIFLGRGGIQNNGLPLLSGKDLLYVAELLGYGGWALYWGIPPCFRWWRKLADKLMIWGFIGLSAAIFLLILGFVASIYYAYFGGGTLAFLTYWWRSRVVASAM